jgi:F0F1-type ATP synthase assembly protein I
MGPWALLLQLGWTIALSIVGSLLVGVWFDSTLGTSPLGVLFFSLIGIILGSVAVYRQVVRAIESIPEEDPTHKKKYRKYDFPDDDDSEKKGDE